MKPTALALCAALLSAALVSAVLQSAVIPRGDDCNTHAPERPGIGAVMIARGTFEVRVSPQKNEDEAGEPFSRVLLDKQLRGDVVGTSTGHMLGAETAVQGSAGYVALELVTATVHGRRGTFILQHSGHMARGVTSMTATVVPDSATGELTGLAGLWTITISDGQHVYVFEYTLSG